jgi:hypothetical protein
MNLHLTGLGWLNEAPKGNRLRWSYPLQGLESVDQYLGLPEIVIVERAWLDEDIPQQSDLKLLNPSAPSLPIVPSSWWDSHGDVHPGGFLPKTHILPKPVQAIRFTYRGASARLRAFDSENDLLVCERMVNDGEVIHLEASAIDQLEILAWAPVLQNFMILDLFADRGLKWEMIAQIRVKDTIGFDLDEVRLRYDQLPTLTNTEWKEFVEGATRGQVSKPGSEIPGDPTDWEAFSVLMGLRWEHALLFGHAFFDGPRSDVPEFDQVKHDLLLTDVPRRPVAYRVRDAKKRVDPSNIIVCPPWIIPPLSAPSQPQYEHPEVRLTSDPETSQPRFSAIYGMRWQQSDVNALGVQIQEETTKSPAIGSSPSSETYESRTRFPEDSVLEGALARSRDVPFHDVQILCCARATDGLDRVSAYSPWTPTTSLSFEHAAPAPNFTAARYAGTGDVRLTRQTNDLNFPDWQPDLVIENDPLAKLFVYRRKSGVAGQPAVQSVSVSAPVWVEDKQYRTTVSGAGALSIFLNGSLIVAPYQTTIRSITGSDIHFEVADGTSVLFSAGPARLQQDPNDLALWTKVAEFSPIGLPDELVFPDPVPGPSGVADVLSYQARLSYLGQLGPVSNTVQAVRIPPTPVVPPPFTIETLGIDFYNRTMVKIRFTNPVSGGLYTVWSANGALTSSQFGEKGVPGEQRAQTPYKNRYLFDVLTIPLPQAVSRTVTIGVQQVNEGGGQSTFETVQYTLPTLTP